MVSRALYKSIFFTGLISSGFINSSFVVAEELPTVVVSATRSEQSSITTPASINVISRKEIESSGASNLNEVLRGQAGIQVFDLYGDAGSTVVSLRGFAENANANILVMVDGRRLNYTDTRAPDLSHISLTDIERIEIIEGSAGVLFGDQAVGGVINIVTRKPEEFNAAIELRMGSFSRKGVAAYISDISENGFSYKLNAEAYVTDNYRDHNEHSNVSVSGYVDQEYSEGNVFAEIQKLDDNLELPGALIQSELDADRTQINNGFVDDFSNTDAVVKRIGIRHAVDANWSFEAEATKRKVDQDIEQSFRNSPSGATGYSDRDLDSVNPRLIGIFSVDNGEALVTIGADREDGDFELFIPNSSGVARLNNDQDMKSVYAQIVMPLNKTLSTTFGVRKSRVDNDISDTGTFTFPVINENIKDSVTVTELGFKLKTSSTSSLSFRMDENFRFAKIDEFSLAGGVLLETQEGTSWEASYNNDLGESNYKFSVYKLDLENEIFYDPSAGAWGANVNLDKTVHNGVMFDYINKINHSTAVSFNYTYTDAKIKTGSFSGNDISGVSDNLASIRLTHDYDDNWQFYGEITGVDDKYAQGDNANTQEKIRGYAVTNVASVYKYKMLKITARINNFMGKEYAEFITNNGYGAAYQPSPERSFLLTAGYRF